MAFQPVEFGKYRLIEPLKQGGMAEIFLAKQLGPMGYEKTVVIKRVLSHFTQHSEFIEMFLDEARLAARLEHPNIVQIHDFGEVDGSYFLCMEYLRGEDVHALIRGARKQQLEVPAQVAAIIVSAACDALHYAHTLASDDGQPLHIVHRDVSPSNLFVTHQGIVKVLDFGIARAEGKIVKTSAGVVRGKLAYMSPEQARGVHVDARTDVWALGTVLHELLTGTRFFWRNNEPATIRALMDDPIPPPSELVPTVPKELDAICLKALQRDVNARYADAHAMYEDLDDYLSSRTYVPSNVQLQQFVERVIGKQPAASGSQPAARVKATGPVPAAQPVTAATKADRRATDGRPTTLERSSLSQSSDVPLPTVSPLQSKSFVALLLLTLCLISAAATVWIARGLRPDPPVIVSAAPVEPPTQPKAAEPEPEPQGEPDKQPDVTPTPTATPTPTPTPEPAKPRAPARGTLDVNCVPWCEIWIDDKNTNRTSPAVGISLAPGHHKLKVVNPPTGVEQERDVTIRPGASAREIVKF